MFFLEPKTRNIILLSAVFFAVAWIDYRVREIPYFFICIYICTQLPKQRHNNLIASNEIFTRILRLKHAIATHIRFIYSFKAAIPNLLIARCSFNFDFFHFLSLYTAKESVQIGKRLENTETTSRLVSRIAIATRSMKKYPGIRQQGRAEGKALATCSRAPIIAN